MLSITPTLKQILEKTLPLTIGVFAIMLVQLVDTMYISQLGVAELAIQGITLPFQMVLIGIQVGIGVAATTIISRACGARNQSKAASTASLSLVFGTVLLSLLCILLWALSPYILMLFVATDNSQQFMKLDGIFTDYWPVWLLSAISGACLYLITCVYRANGDAKTTGMAYLAASVINLILDPILIFTLDMGIRGAAIATLIGYGSSCAYMLYKIRNKDWLAPLCLSRKTMNYLSELVRTSVTMIANQLLPSISAFIGMMFIAKLGTDAIAFWSLLSRVESFLLVFTLAMTMSIPPMIGHALGAGSHHNINDLLLTAAKFLLVFHVGVALVLMMVADNLSYVMSSDITIHAWLKTAFWIIPLSYGPLGLCMLVVSAFNALGVPKSALTLSFIRLFVLYIPAIVIGTSTGSVLNTVIAATVANALVGMVAWLKIKRYMKCTLLV